MRALVLLAACSLCLGALASGSAACKGSKSTGQKASATCPQKAKPGARHVARKHSRHKGASAVQDSAAVRAAQAATANLPMPNRLPPDAKPLVHPDSPCFAALGASSASRHIAAKVPFFLDGEASAQLLANTGRPSKMEKTELSSVLAGYEMCLDMSADWRSASYSPQAAGVLDAYWQKTKSILTGLEAGKTSYGEAARAVSENDRAYKNQLNALAPQAAPVGAATP